MVSTPAGEWSYASLCARQWNHEGESAYDPRGWSTLGRETSIQKVRWDNDGWPRIVGGHGVPLLLKVQKMKLRLLFLRIIINLMILRHKS